jgi:hypothetical protein
LDVRGVVDLTLLARSTDNARWIGKYNAPIGLARLVEVYHYRILEKGKITRSNWEKVLDDKQQLCSCLFSLSFCPISVLADHRYTQTQPTMPTPATRFTNA